MQLHRRYMYVYLPDSLVPWLPSFFDLPVKKLGSLGMRLLNCQTQVLHLKWAASQVMLLVGKVYSRPLQGSDCVHLHKQLRLVALECITQSRN